MTRASQGFWARLGMLELRKLSSRLAGLYMCRPNMDLMKEGNDRSSQNDARFSVPQTSAEKRGS